MNLVQTSFLVKRILLAVISIIVLYIIFLTLKPVAISIAYTIFPPKDPPNPKYGRLDQLVFIEKQITTENPTIVLNTANGRLPSDLPARAIVYATEPPEFSYSAEKNAQEHAEYLGFSADELTSDLKGPVYKWRDVVSGGILEIDTDTKTLIQQTQLAGASTYFPAGAISPNGSITNAKSMLTQIDRLDDPLYSQGTQRALLTKIQGSALVETKLASEAQLARVDFFRSVNDFPILGPDPKIGLVNVTLRNPTNEDTSFNYPLINYFQWELIPTSNDPNPARYPLIPVQSAWDAVSKEKKGVIVSVIPKGKSVLDKHVPTKVDQILIDKIFLAYYDTPTRQEYLQPIYVFEGKYNVGNTPGGDIVLYFPALDGEYIKPTEIPPAEITEQ